MMIPLLTAGGWLEEELRGYRFGEKHIVLLKVE